MLSYDVTDALEAPEKNTLGTSNVFVMNGRLYNFTLGVDFFIHWSYGRFKKLRTDGEQQSYLNGTKVDIGFEGVVGRPIFYRPATKTLHLVGLSQKFVKEKN